MVILIAAGNETMDTPIAAGTVRDLYILADITAPWPTTRQTRLADTQGKISTVEMKPAGERTRLNPHQQQGMGLGIQEG